MRKGFTLIELLVVIAIIAILAAILFPVFAKAQEKAKQITCLSNLKELGLGFAMYLSDYDSTYPFTGVWAGGAYRNYWPIAIYPYVKNAGIYQCPKYQMRETGGSSGIGGSWASNYQSPSFFGLEIKGVGYGINPVFPGSGRYSLIGAFGGQDYRGDPDNGLWEPLGEAQLAFPAETWLLVDSYHQNTWQMSILNYTATYFGHNEGLNFVHADGHAKWYSQGAIVGGPNQGYGHPQWLYK